MALKEQVLDLLMTRDDFVSGQEICQRLGVSRTAVWKVINQLKEEGYQFEAVQKKGYRMLPDAEVFSAKEISTRLHTQRFGRNLVFKQVTGSTNYDVRDLAQQGAPEGTLVVADTQETGRGRRGRNWNSPPGTSIAYSVLMRPEIQSKNAGMLTLLMAVAVARTLSEIAPETEIAIKWPNDVLVNKHKCCGILTEMTLEGTDIEFVVCGVGINVNQTEFPEEIASIASSLKIETGLRQNRSAITARTMDHFEALYDLFLESENMAFVKDEYERYLVNRGNIVRVLDPHGEYTGRAEGINEEGELLVRKDDGILEAVYAGEVSVRGIYGYV